MFNFKTFIHLDNKGVHVSLINERADICLELTFFIAGTSLRTKGCVCSSSDAVMDQKINVIPCDTFEEALRYLPELLSVYDIEPNKQKAEYFVKSAWEYENELRTYLQNRKEKKVYKGCKQ